MLTYMKDPSLPHVVLSQDCAVLCPYRRISKIAGLSQHVPTKYIKYFHRFQCFGGLFEQGSLNLPFWGYQTMQIYGRFDGFPL